MFEVIDFVRSPRARAGALSAFLASGALLASGCQADIKKNTQIDGCGENNNSGVVATSIPGQPGYDPRTDPVLLERKYRHDQEARDYSAFTAPFHVVRVGLGEFMCEAGNRVYLTAKALEVARAEDPK